MLIPKFSIRQMLLGMIALGGIFTCMAGASRGNQVALGLSVAIGLTLVPFLVFAIVHWIAYPLASLQAAMAGDVDQSPAQPRDVSTVPAPVFDLRKNTESANNMESENSTELENDSKSQNDSNSTLQDGETKISPTDSEARELNG